MNVRPFIKTPFTDMFGRVESCQNHPVCAEFELRMANCLDAYGIDRGVDKCHDLIHDFYECTHQSKRIFRFMMMNRERIYQYAKTGEEYKWLPMPPADLL